MKKVFKYVSIVFVILAFILASYILIFGSIARKNNELLTFLGYSYSVVPTDSMDGNYPDSIKPVSLIITKNVSYDDLAINDIIVFKSNEDHILIVHRIVDINEEGNFITKGDNPNAALDDPLMEEQYQAMVVKTIKIPDFLGRSNGFQLIILLILILVLIMFALYQVIVIVRTIKENKLKEIKLANEAKLRAEILKELKEETEEK